MWTVTIALITETIIYWFSYKKKPEFVTRGCL